MNIGTEVSKFLPGGGDVITTTRGAESVYTCMELHEHKEEIVCAQG